jgi:arabinofuranosyltransferase
MLWHAWLSDDAYILLRSVDNAVRGYGLRWNVAERVQSFTCPLWTLLITAVYALTREEFFTTLVLSVAVSLGALALCLRAAPTRLHALLVVLALTGSRAFVDYSTSGLENPLSHLLLGGFLLVLARPEAGGRYRMGLLSLLSALLLTNRMDLGLVVAPALLWEAWRARSWRTVGLLVLGQVPFLAWEVFSLVYYGFPFPNTAYAKLNNGVPSGELALQGLRYLDICTRFDPPTSLALLVGLGATVRSRRPELVAGAVGVALYLVYVVRVGGDFMAGRFLTVPLYASVMLGLLARPELSLRGVRVALGVLALSQVAGPLGVAVAEAAGVKPLRWYNTRTAEPAGIGNERTVYAEGAGLRHWRPGRPWPAYYFCGEGRADRARYPDGAVLPIHSIGMRGFCAGPTLYYVDIYALTDPLLARMVRPQRHWRIGHFDRDLPEGYLETLSTGRNVIKDPALAAYLDKLNLVVRGPLFTRERWSAIWELNRQRTAPAPLAP